MHQCPVCSNPTVFVGAQKGVLDQRDFYLRTCLSCRYSYVENYRDDYSLIYDEKYYKGCGADPLVDYIHELQNPEETIRQYEWRGVFQVFMHHFPKGGRWLDFGCGAGGLVKYAISQGIDAIGAEDGWASDQGRRAGVPILHIDELEKFGGQFDFISAIEVIEHIPNPLQSFKLIRSLLKTGGVFFLTTGNARPWRNKLLKWSYTNCPDVHVSFLEPKTLSLCLEKSGFRPEKNHFEYGFEDIIKFKILKNIGIKSRSNLVDMIPWGVITKVADAKYGVSKHPCGIAI
jgi:SAM-dependent methyltransferase